MEDKKAVYFPNLDVIRTLCAFMIIILHSYGGWKCWNGYHFALTDGDEDLTVFGKYIDTLINNMSIGVDLFFLISGFLITYLLLVEKQTNGKVDIKKFFIRRFLRIWPLYFFIIIMGPIWLLLKKDLGPTWLQQPPDPNYLSYLLFLGNFKAGIMGEFPVGHLWSICVEERFYLVWPFIIAFVPFKHLSKVFVGIILSSIMFRAYYYHFHPEFFSRFFGYLTLTNMDTLVIGSYCALLYFEKPRIFKTSVLVRVIVTVLFLFTFGIETYKSADSLFTEMFKKYIYLCFAIFMMGNFMFNEKILFNHKKTPLHYLGKISYGLYMYQSIVITILTDYLLLTLGVKNPWIFYGTIIAAIVFISIISWEVFEKQVLKLKKRFVIVRTTR